MNRLIELVAIVAAIAYLGLLAVAIGSTTYDVWGVLVVIPPLGVIGAVLIRAMFSGPFESLRPILYAGLGAKLVGTALRYWVGFEAYAGGIDAQRYHDFAVRRVADVGDGRLSPFDLVPTGTGTPFTEEVTALLYALVGSSKMGGFVVFGFLGYVGVVCFVKAAVIAVPGLAAHPYAALSALAPSLAYWPSSIGKEALMMLGLGAATLGVARYFATREIAIPVLMAVGGLAFTGAIRPHLSGIWLAGVMPALLVMFARANSTEASAEGRRIGRGSMIGMIGIAGIGLVLLVGAAVRYLPTLSDDEGIASIVEETTRRTEQARSSFDPPNITNPVMWPYAIVRTLTRPLLIEARGAAQLFTALEMTLLVGLAMVSYRRLIHVPKLVVTVPFVTFAMTSLCLAGLAFSSFANLGILARQKSLIFPFLLLLVCLPALPRRPDHDPEGERAERREHNEPDDRELVASGAQNSSTSPRASAQLLSGGMPRSFTARQVSIGPPPGSGTNPDDDLWAPRRIT